ncbi:MAG TPA: NUDIX hydrolase [Candidatus Thalassarchaeaceae archaeon]|nr:NUDIX hydrolase [Candidatus Thalassarchaeaceae archaeon]
MGLRHLHLEHDGKLLLVDADGIGPQIPVPGRTDTGKEGWIIRLPTEEEVEKMGIKWNQKRINTMDNGTDIYSVIYATPIIDWPANWAWKDYVISDSAVHPLARESVYRTMHRLVSKVIIRDTDGLVLLGKVLRGHFKGFWTLPGGYLDYSEHPRIGAIREAYEEMGIDIVIADPMGESGEAHPGDDFCHIQEQIFSSEGIQYVSFTYLVDLDHRPEIQPKPDEIEEGGWFSLTEAIQKAASIFDKEALEALQNLEGNA